MVRRTPIIRSPYGPAEPVIASNSVEAFDKARARGRIRCWHKPCSIARGLPPMTEDLIAAIAALCSP